MATKRKPFAVIDLETDPFKAGRYPKPFAAGFYDGCSYCQYWGDNCIDYLIDDLKDFDGYVYAHNGGKFDYHFMLDHVEKGKIKIINGRIAQMKIGDAICRDSWNILPVPLAAFDKTKIDYSKFERENREHHKGEILDYLKSDCINLYQFIDAFFQRFPRKLTLSTIAINELQKECGEIEKQNIHHDKKFREFYYGGRVECFESGCIKGNFQFVDIKSAYPNAMLGHHPTGKHYDLQREIPSDPIKQLCSFYTVIGTSRGAFPVRDKKGGISFGEHTGEFKITGHELMAAFETGRFDLNQVVSVWVPRKTISFAPFVNKFYDEKLAAEQQGDATTRLLTKLILNSSYGKFAANVEKYKDWHLYDAGKVKAMSAKGYTLELTDFGEWWLWSQPIDPEGPQANYYDVATAASITGSVRAFMLKSIHAVERPLYCDTDSILCADPGGLDMGEQLGQWELENRVSEAHIAGKKLYAVKTESGWKVASKGVKASVEQIQRAAAGHSVKVARDTPTYSAITVPTFQDRTIRNTADKSIFKLF